MAHDRLTYDDLLRIVELVKSSEQFSEFRLKVGDIEVELRRRVPGTTAPASSTPPQPLPAAPAAQPATAPVPPPSTPAPPPSRDAPGAWPPDAIVIRAPMVGTFYRAPQPGAAPFVAEGSAVEPDTVVCIIEVMKLMNSIAAGAAGTVTQVLVEDAAAVETGQPLVVLAPRAA